MVDAGNLDRLQHAIWEALTTSQQHLARTHGQARQYLANVAPFAAIEEQTSGAMKDLRTLLQPEESTHLLGPPPVEIAGLQVAAPVPVLQMLLPPSAALPGVSGEIGVESLTCAHAAEMLALIEVAYPGFFRAQTCRMGRYYGVRDPAGQLIAMGGERLILQPFREVSGVCTLPGRTGQGLGTAVLHRILREQRAAGAVPWLYVLASNRRAVELYLRLGFQLLREVDLHRVTRV